MKHKLNRMYKAPFIITVLSFAYVLSLPFISSTYFKSVEIHSAVEGIGGVIAVLLSFILTSQKHLKNDYPNLYLFGLSFLTMGLFDTTHAFLPEGNEFVFFHSMAGFLGSIILLGMFFKNVIKTIAKNNLVFYATLCINLILIASFLFYSDLVPLMIDGQKFTFLANSLNFISGLFFLIAAIKITRLKTVRSEYNYTPFIYITLLLAISGFTFFYSKIWNIEWWMWHILRISAFFITAFIIIYHQEELLKKIQSKNNELEHFTNIVSHDLQEPLNSIIGFSKLLKKRKLDFNEVEKNSLDIIDKSAIRMKEFVISLLDHYRLGKQTEKKDVNILELIDNIKSDLNNLIQNRNVQIIYKGKNLTFKAFEHDITKLFQNIIANGIKYTNETTHPKIIIQAKENIRNYIFSIRDNGIGIAKEDQEKIFDAFYRINSTSKVSGTGLGLSHCKKIIELHDGQIWLESELGKGSTFYFSIPKTSKK